ncbi:MAG: glucose PTS transporter subunit IIA [Bacillota bacterium]
MRTRAVLERLPAALMVPVVVLPVGAIFFALGTQLGLSAVEAAGRAILIDYLPLIFSIGVAIAYCEQDGIAAMSAGLCWAVMKSTLSASGANLDTGVIGGILCGAVSVILYNRYHTVRLPEYLGLFSGKRFVPVISAAAGLIIGQLLAIIWSPVQEAIASLGRWIVTAGAPGAFVYGLTNRFLIPTGLHHIVNNVVMFVAGSYTDPVTGQVVFGEAPRFYAGDPAAGYLFAGYFVTCVFAIPALSMAIAHEASPENRRKVTGIMVTAALTSAITGITEPAEFAFMFVAPALFLFHSVYTGLTLWLTYSLGVRHFGFALPMFFINLGLAENPWLIVPIGLATVPLYYFGFRWAIRRFNIPTLGRVEDARTLPSQAEHPGQEAPGMVGALGGASNVVSVDACMTRLRILVEDPSLVQASELRRVPAVHGVTFPAPGVVQVVVGPRAEIIKEEVKDMLGKLLIKSPITGRAVGLSDVGDPVFAERMVGDGIAVEPEEGRVYAPFDAEVVTVVSGGHGLGLKDKRGREMLIHIGIDTVEMAGEGFCAHVTQGQRVKAGQLLLEFDIGKIRAAGKPTVSPIVITKGEITWRATPGDRVLAMQGTLLVVR